jgi:hypothetical protein
MQKNLFLFLLAFTIIDSFGQVKPFDTKKYGDNLMRCFYTVKASFLVSPECRKKMQHTAYDIATWLGNELTNHRTVFAQKLSQQQLKDMRQLIDGFLNHAMDDPENGQLTASFKLTLELYQGIVDNIFTKLQAP